MNRFVRISGVRCLVENDQHGFIDISIDDHNYVEWIVRGAIDLPTAYAQAKGAIELLKSGHFLIHNSEGQILNCKNPYREGEGWKEKSPFDWLGGEEENL